MLAIQIPPTVQIIEMFNSCRVKCLVLRMSECFHWVGFLLIPIDHLNAEETFVSYLDESGFQVKEFGPRCILFYL